MTYDPHPEDRSVVCKYLNYTYHNRDGSIQIIRLPLINIRLQSSVKEIETIALMDTGSTNTLIPMEISEILELEYLKSADGNFQTTETTGAGGKFNCFISKIMRLILLKNVTSFCIYSGIDILIPELKDILPYVIIGRDYVFPRYDITFHESRQKMTFTKLNV